MVYESEDATSLNSLLASSVVNNSGHDKKIWTTTSDKSFSVNTCCALIKQTINERDLPFQIDFWLKNYPSKIQCFI
jgi:hypothetical protein